MTTAQSPRESSFRFLRGRTGAFFVVWLGQSLSLIGTGVTGFALGVWIYQTTGSVIQFTLVAVFGSIPGLLLAPVLGAVLEDWDRRWAMALSDGLLGLRTVGLLALFAAGQLEVWHIYVAVALRSIFEAIQIPAYSSAVSLLIPKKHLGRANGMRQFGDAAARILAPAVAGVLMPFIGLGGLLTIDIVTFLFAIGTLLLVRIPRPEQSAAGRRARGNLWQRSIYGWRYIRQRPGFLSLTGYFALLNLALGGSLVLLTPLVLSFGTATQLGFVLSLGSIGSLVGSSVMSAWGGPRKKIHGVLGFTPVLGLGLILIGLQPSAVWVASGVACFFFALPLVNASSLAIWQAKVEGDVQMMVFSTRKLIAQITSPLAYLLAGPLAEDVLQPLLDPSGPLASSVGAVLGVGEGRGMGLQCVLFGCMLLALAAAGWAFSPLRHLEDRLPDADTDEPAGA